MKKYIIAASVGLMAMTECALAADQDREIGLIVSGVVDSWVGVQFIDGEELGDETVVATGGQGLLSLPLGKGLSLQNDYKYEVNQQSNEPLSQSVGPRYSYQGAIHMSWRDPSWMLIGAFGGIGSANFGPIGGTATAYFVGGEAQVYLENITLYGQLGHVNFTSDDYSPHGLDHSYFARGVLRWFLNSDTRLQFEATYLQSEFGEVEQDYDVFSIGARYDIWLSDLPLIGDTPVFAAYRGTFRSDCIYAGSDASGIDDHTFMIGSSYSFSGDRITVDRRGATLDTPDFNHSCFLNPGSTG